MKCTHEPREMNGMPIGQYHCPDCGVMVLAGLPHPEICEHSGYPDYAAMCDICSPGWEKELEEANKKLENSNE